MNDCKIIASSSQRKETQKYATVGNFPAIGTEGIIYIDLSEDKAYLWDSASSEYVPLSGGGANFTRQIYVDSNATAGGDGTSSKPYQTVEEAKAATSCYDSISGVTTNGLTTIGTISGSDIAKLRVGQYVTGAGIPYSSTILSIGGSSIIISKACTASATITIKAWNPVTCWVYGSGTITSDWYKEGFYIKNYGEWFGDGLILLNQGTAVSEIDYQFENFGKITLTGATSRFYYYSHNGNNALYHQVIKDFRIGQFESEGTDYQVYHTYYPLNMNTGYGYEASGCFRIRDGVLNAKSGKIGYLSGTANIDLDATMYGTTYGWYMGGIGDSGSGTSLANRLSIRKPIICPLNIEALQIVDYVVNIESLIRGNVVITGSGIIQGTLDGYTAYFNGAPSSGGLFIKMLRPRVSTDIYGYVSVETVGSHIYNIVTYNIYGNVSFNKYIQPYTGVMVVKNGGVLLLNCFMHSVSMNVNAGGKCIYNNQNPIYSSGFFITVSGTFINQGYLNLDEHFSGVLIANGGHFINTRIGNLYLYCIGTNNRFEISAGGKATLDGLIKIEGTGGYITKSGGKLELNGVKFIAPANQNIIKCTANTSDSKDIQLINATTNCDGTTYSLLNAFDGGSYAPNPVIMGTLIESNLIT